MRTCVLLVCIAAVGCGPTSKDGGGGGNGDAVDATPGTAADARQNPNEFSDAAPAQACDKMDIVFVIDDSGSMELEQANLALNFPKFIEVLDMVGNLDYRVAVTTTGRDYAWTTTSPLGPLPMDQNGNNGALMQRCDMTRPWVESTDATRKATFACAAEVGVGGPSKEMPLGVVKQAFGDRVTDGTNSGFLRDDALLAIVVLTDEDDCSYEQSVSLGFTDNLCDSDMEPVSTYVSFLDGVKGDRGRWAVAVIAGLGPGSCSSDFGTAAEATRLKDFVSQTGANGVTSSICDGDLAPALAAALDTFDTACQSFPPID